VSVNMMEGPGPSSVATRVMGTGLEVNFGMLACRLREGRSLALELGGRVEVRPGVAPPGVVGDFMVSNVSWEDVGRLFEPSDLREVVSAETFGRGSWTLILVGASLVDGPEVVPNDELGLESRGLRSVSEGTVIGASPVDFFDTGGPRILSPWLRLRLRGMFVGICSDSDS
jgi:hypothetical protein